jgi:hypothetical protein
MSARLNKLVNESNALVTVASNHRKMALKHPHFDPATQPKNPILLIFLYL